MSVYLYRIAETDAAGLTQAIIQIVGFPCWTFSGAIFWDLIVSDDQAERRKNLRTIEQTADAASLDLRGDFGHAFLPHAEVRWKRLDNGGYDLLILADSIPKTSGAETLQGIQGWTVKRDSSSTNPKNRQQIVLTTPSTVQRKQWSLGYIEYLDATGRTQLVRYTTRYEEAVP